LLCLGFIGCCLFCFDGLFSVCGLFDKCLFCFGVLGVGLGSCTRGSLGLGILRFRVWVIGCCYIWAVLWYFVLVWW